MLRFGKILNRPTAAAPIPGQFVLSGSANFSILENITESLAGRAVYLAIYPFNRREVARNTGAEPFIKKFFEKQDIRSARPARSVRPEDILLGGMPTVCLRQVEDPAVWFKGFEQTYLERDVREMSQVGNLMALRALLRLTALRTGQLLSPSQLRLEKIMESSDGIGWGYHDDLGNLFSRAFPEE